MRLLLTTLGYAIQFAIVLHLAKYQEAETRMDSSFHLLFDL